MEQSKRIVFGDVAWCPTCRGTKKKTVNHKKVDCAACGGTGIIPNKGPVPGNMKVMPRR